MLNCQEVEEYQAEARLPATDERQVNVLSTKANTHTGSVIEQVMLQTVFDSVPEAVIVTDTEGKVLLANPAAHRLYGHPIACGCEFNAEGDLQILHPTGTPFEERQLPLVRSACDGCICENIEMVIVRPDGRHIDLMANTAPLLDNHGAIAGAVGVFQNVTASKQTHDERQKLLTDVREYVVQLKEANERLKKQSEQLESQKANLELLSAELGSKSAFLEIVFEQMPAGLVIADAQTGKIIFANKRVSEILGQPLFPMNNIRDLLNITAQRSDGKPCEENDRPLVRSLRNGETISDEELRFNRPDGGVSIALINSSAVRDRDGRIIAAAAIFQDITEKKRVEAELRKHKRSLEALVSERTVELKIANERLEKEAAQRTLTQEALVEQSAVLEAFFRNAPIPLVILDRDFHFIMVNEEYAIACQRDVDSFRGRNHFELYPNEENKAIFERVVATKTPFHTIAKPFVFADHPEWGVTYWDWSLVPILDKNNEVELLVFSLNNVTRHKKAQEEIAQLSQFHKTIIDTADVWIFVTDEKNNIIIWNRTAEKVSGYTRQEMIGSKKPWQLIYPEPDYREKTVGLFHSVQTDGKVIEDFETTIHTKTCQSRTICWDARPLIGSCGNRVGIMAVGKDITEQKEMDEKMRRYQKQLRCLASKMSLAEEQLRRRIASDLHDGLGQLLAMSKIKLAQVRKHIAETDLSGQINEIHRLVEEAIGYTRSLTVELSPPVLYELGLEAALEWLCEQIEKQHKIQCTFKNCGFMEPLDCNHRIVLFQIIRELMHNVAKHAQACTATVSVDTMEGNIRVSVIDDGVGFDVHEVSTRADHVGGFGLFNVRERLSQLGGSLDVSSALGRGTHVTVIAPIKPS